MPPGMFQVNILAALQLGLDEITRLMYDFRIIHESFLMPPA